MLSDALMVLFHRAPVLLGVVIAPPVPLPPNGSSTISTAPSPPTPRASASKSMCVGIPCCALATTPRGTYRCPTHNAVATRKAHFEDSAPVCFLHSRKKYIYALDIGGVTTLERFTASNLSPAPPCAPRIWGLSVLGSTPRGTPPHPGSCGTATLRGKMWIA